MAGAIHCTDYDERLTDIFEIENNVEIEKTQVIIIYSIKAHS